MDWLTRFRAGDRALLGEIYSAHLAKVDRFVGGVLSGADRETVVHEVFFRLMSDPQLRRAFHGGDLGSWLAAVARNHAIDYARRRNREMPAGLDLEPGTGGDAGPAHGESLAARAEARLLLQRFQSEVLPPEWGPVFEARFVRSLNQSEAARALRISRTTLVYRELRIRKLLRAFLLEDVP